MISFNNAFLLQQPCALIAYLLLFLSVIFAWYRPRFFIWIFILAISLALYSEKLFLTGALSICAFWLLVVTYINLSKINIDILQKTLKGLIFFIIIFLGFLLKLHLLPGFNNWQIVSNLTLSDNAVPYNMYLNFDSTIVGLFLIAYFVPKASFSILKKVFFKNIILIIISILFLMFIALVIGWTVFETNNLSLLPIWAISNLLSTCVTEECLFRELILKRLCMIFPNALSLLLVSILFGAIHYPGGGMYIVLASIAGFFYGIVYLRTKMIEVSIILHFLVNLIHFLFFAYPMANMSL